MLIWFVLIVCAYLLGSVPTSYIAAKSRGIDLRQQGTKQVGGGNLWRTTSRKLGFLVSFLDFIKGMVMISVAAYLAHLRVDQQMVIGLAAIVGHNWPVFLRFHGGRGVASLLGVVTIIPAINGVTPLPVIIAFSIVVVGFLIKRTSPLPVFIGAASLPVTSWRLDQEITVTLAFLAMFLVVVIKRLTAQPSTEAASISRSQILLNRLLFDRDIRDRKAWLNRKPDSEKEQQED